MKRPTKLTRNGKRNGRPLKKDAEKKKEVSKVLQRIEDCKTNPEEFISRFLYTFNPKKDPYHLPFKLFPFQRKLVWDLKELIEKGEDVFIEKCREMGATYTVLDVFLWFWLYIPGSNFLLGSRKEQYVDNTKGGGGLSNKEESLFGKLEYTIGRMYPFMLPEGFSLKKHCTYMSILNPVNGNVISGESSNPNFSRGGRFKAILLDEFAFWDNGCFHKGTEVLTDSGWKLVKDCSLSDMVYSMDEKGDAVYMPISRRHRVFAKELIYFKNKAVDLMVTDNHKMLLKKRYSGNYYFRRADKVSKQKHDYLPLVSNFIGENSPKDIFGYNPDDFMEFLGWFVSEGHSCNKARNRKIGISQSLNANRENVEQIKALLRRMGLPINFYGKGFQISAGYLPKETFDLLCSLGKAKNKFIPRQFLNMKKDLLLVLLDSLIKGDGNRIRRKDRVDKLNYATTSKQLADDVQELAQKVGLKASIRERKTNLGGIIRGKRVLGRNPLYILNFGFKPHAQVACLNQKRIAYNDYAYCLTTKFHTLYVRRNGVASWCGNSAAWGSTADTTQCRIVLTTPGLQPSKAKRLRYGTDGEEIKIITLPYHLDPRKTKEWIKKEKTRRSDSDFSREIMINWETSTAGRVYPEIELSEMIINEYEERLMLYCSWDFGLDGTAIQWWQKKDKWVLIDSYQNTNKPITWFVPFVGGKIDSTFSYTDEDLRIIKNHASWKDGVHFGDPDVSKRNLVTGTSTRQTLEAANIYVQTNTESNDFASRREKTKVFLQTGILVNKTIGNEIWMDCIREARYPQRAETAQVTTPIVIPIHDQTSHHRTALEYFCVNIDEHKPGAITRESSTNQLENKIGNQSLTESLTQLL